MENQDLLKQILTELREMKSSMVTREDLKETKEYLIEEMKRVADTLETIAVGEAAATAEKLQDKVEAGDVILKSFIDRLEMQTRQLENRFDSQDEVLKAMEKRFDSQDEVLKEIVQGIETITRETTSILSALSDKIQKQDDMIDLINRELIDQRGKTLAIRQRLNELEKKVKEHDDKLNAS